MKFSQGATAADSARLFASDPLRFKSANDNYFRNFAGLLLDGAFFGLTLSFVSEQTLVPYLVQQLSNSSLLAGLVPAIRHIGFLGPQIVASHWVYGRSSKKPLVWCFAASERLALLLLILVLALWGRFPNSLLLATFLACYGFFYATTGIMAPGYQDIIAKHIIWGRGLLFGLNRALAGTMVFGSSFIIAWAIQSHPLPQSFVVIFFVAFVVSIPSLLAFSIVKETPYSGMPARRELLAYLAETPNLLRQYPVLGRYLLFRGLLGISAMGTPFLATFAIIQLGFAPESIGAFTTIMISSQYFSVLVAGWVGDRIGYKAVIVPAAVALVGSYIAILVGSASTFVHVGFLLAGVTTGALQVADPNMIFEISPPEETPRFVGIANTLLTPAIAFAPLLAGILVERVSYVPMFLLALSLTSIVAILLVIQLDEPRDQNLEKLCR